MATGLWMATEQESPAGSGRTVWWEEAKTLLVGGWLESGTRVDMTYGAPGLVG